MICFVNRLKVATGSAKTAATPTTTRSSRKKRSSIRILLASFLPLLRNLYERTSGRNGHGRRSVVEECSTGLLEKEEEFVIVVAAERGTEEE